MTKISEARIEQAIFWGELICLDCGASQEKDEELGGEIQHCEVCSSPYLMEAALVEKVRLALGNE